MRGGGGARLPGVVGAALIFAEAQPTIPLDPPTAYGLAALFVLFGRRLVRAGRGSAAFRAAMLFVVVFALTVQYFLFRWPGWMYAYLIPEGEVSLAWVSPAFFVAVVAAGAVGASLTLHLLRRGRMGWAVANAVLGLGTWGLIWAITWDQYFLIGDYESYHAGLAIPLPDAPSFQAAMNVVGAIQVVVGVGALLWVLRTGSLAKRAASVQPDPAPSDWRKIGTEAAPAPPPSASSVIDGAFIRGLRPTDGEPLTPLPITPVSSIPSLVAAAREAQRPWAALSLEERVGALRLAGKRLLERAEEAARILESENGRPRAESLLSEVIPSADLFSYWTSRGSNLLQGDEVQIDPITFPGKRGVIEQLPRGVVAAISPWNFPLMLPLRTVVPALLAGNAVVLKPSEYSARSGAFIASIFEGIVAPGLLTVIQGGGDAAQEIIAAGVDSVIFIGSARTGRRVAQACAEQLTPVTLELGGKDAAIVLEDADVDRTANGITWGAFANAGQNCAAIERCYVVESIAAPFIEALRAQIDGLRLGPGKEGEVELGPLTTPAQKASVEAQLAQARERGLLQGPAPSEIAEARASPPSKEVDLEEDAAAGGSRASQPRTTGTSTARGAEAAATTGLYVKPAFVVDPPEDLAISCEESFGPVLAIFRVKDAEEAIRKANASPYGLTVSVWSKDTNEAERIGRRVHAGVVTVNNHAFTGALAQAPWGGVRGSGYGVTNSPRILDALTQPRFVLVDRSKAKRELWWYPYDAGKLRLARGLINLRAGGSGKAKALGEVLRGFLGGGGSR